MQRVFCLLIVLCALSTGAGAAAAAVPPPPAAQISPGDMQAVLDVLNDPVRRAAFTATLQAMVRATHAVTRKPAPAAAVPLTANSVGAQVIASSAGWFENLRSQAKSLNNVLGNLPAVWNFTRQTFADPDRRAAVLDAAWHLGLVVLVAGAVEWTFFLVLRRPINALARRGPGGGLDIAAPGIPPATPDTDATEEREAAAEAALRESVGPDVSEGRQRRLARTLRTLRRIPLVLARLLLELLPVATFLGLGWLGMGFLRPETQYVLWAAITAYVGLRVAVVVARALVAPHHASLRVLHVSDTTAPYIVRWVRRLAAWIAFGYAASLIGTEYGLSDTAREAFIKAVALVAHLLLIIIVWQCRKKVAAAIRRGAGEAGWGAAVAGRVAATWHLVATFLIAGPWLVWAARVPNGYQIMWRIFLGTAAVSAALRLANVVVLGGLERFFRIKPELASRYPGLEDRTHFYLPVLRRTVGTLLWMIAILGLLEVWGLNVFAWFRGNALGGKLASAIASIVVVGLVMLLIWEVANSQFERRLAQLARRAQNVQAARLRTLMPILRTVLLAVLLGVFGLNALAVIGVDVGPLLAGAGILGVAIGFGSQKLVQDFITGIFLLLENAMQVGDNVTVAGLSGTVENLSIRTMRLRAGDGSVHIIPFSSVSTVTNVNRGIGNVPVSVSVTSDTDTDHLSDLLAEIAREMRGERRFADMMRSDFQLWGVDSVQPGAVTVVGQIVCTDDGRWPVQREFNRRLAIRLRAEHIRLTSPMQTVMTLSQQVGSQQVGSQQVGSQQVVASVPPA
jgi:small-conductance mechanosensitive channel